MRCFGYEKRGSIFLGLNTQRRSASLANINEDRKIVDNGGWINESRFANSFIQQISKLKLTTN